MKTFSATIIALFLSALCLPEERLIPVDDFYVSVETNDWLNRRGAGDRLNVSVRVSRNAETPEGSTSIDVNCFEFDSHGIMLSEADMNAFFETSAAAKYDKAFRREVITQTFQGKQKSIYEVVSIDGKLMVQITRGQRKAAFLPSEGDKVKQALVQAKAGEAWFKKLLDAKKQPAETSEAKPPQSDGYFLSSKLGEVSGRGINYAVALTASSDDGEQHYRIEHQLRFFHPDGRESGTSGGWVEELLSKVCLAIEAIKKGQEYSFKSDEDDGCKYTVTANLATKEADLVLNPGNFFNDPDAKKGHFGEQQLAEIRKLIERCDERKKWFEDHEHLFFSHPPKNVEQERDELGLREYLLNEGFAIYAKTNEICYISFGSRLNTNQTQYICTTTNSYSVPPPLYASPRAIHIDPPVDFLNRFTGRHFSVKPASQYPKPKDIWGLEKNPKTGVPDGLYTVEVIEWIDNGTAKVRYSMHRAALWAAGYEAIVEKRNGEWCIKGHKKSWIS